MCWKKILGVGEQDKKEGELSRKMCKKYRNYLAIQYKTDALYSVVQGTSRN